MNALKYWCETSLFLSQAVLKYVVSKDFFFKKSVQKDQFCILPRMKKSMALFHIKKFSCHVTLATFKMKTSTCGSQVGHIWVTSGLFCGSLGLMGQQV